jgi:hypothetical protein
MRSKNSGEFSTSSWFEPSDPVTGHHQIAIITQKVDEKMILCLGINRELIMGDKGTHPMGSFPLRGDEDFRREPEA